MMRLTSEDAYALMTLAFKERKYECALAMAILLTRALHTGRLRLRVWRERIPQIVEIERAATERLVESGVLSRE